MSNINEIVSISITRGIQTVDRQGFGIPLILGSNCSSFGTDLVRTYTDIDGVADDFLVTSKEYKMANVIFSQEIRPTYLKIGKCGVAVKNKVKVAVTNVVNNGVYKITINGTQYTYTADASALNTEITAGLISAITVGAEPVTMVDGTAGDAGTFTIEANVAGIDFSYAIPLDGYLSVTATETLTVDPAVALAAIKEVDNDFYVVLCTSKTASDIALLAAYVETLTALYIANTSDSIVTTTSTSDIASVLKALAYDRTVVTYSALEENFLAEAWASVMLPRDPGSATWKFKTGVGISADSFTDTVKGRILGKNCNTYTTLAGVTIFENGTTIGGEWIDIIQGADWIKVNIQADVYQTLVNEDKVPYTKAGIEALSGVILAVLKTAITMGILTSDVTPTVVTPDVTTISAANKAARILPDIKFYGKFAGAIHKVSLVGKITV